MVLWLDLNKLKVLTCQFVVKQALHFSILKTDVLLRTADSSAAEMLQLTVFNSASLVYLKMV